MPAASRTLLSPWRLDAPRGPLRARCGRGAEAGRRPIRYTITGRAPFERLGASFDVLGDIDGDRTEDVLVRCGPVVEQRFSSTGERGLSFYNNYWLTSGYPFSLGDVDGDGVPDFVVGVPHPQGWPVRGRLIAHSGRGGTLWEYVSEEDRTVLGGWMARIDDLDGDGLPELAVGEPGGEQWERLPGKLHIFRAKDGALIRTLTDGVVANYFGASFAQISDLDGDGVRELAVGATNATVRGLKGAGAVHALRLADGRILWSIPGLNGDRTPLGEGYLGDVFGGPLASLGDIDADGAEDVAIKRGGYVAYSEGDWRRIVVASGRRGSPLAVLEAEQDHIGFASSIRRLGDIDRDGRPEFAASAPRYDSAASGNGSWSYGRIYVLGYDPEGVPFIRGDADADGRVNVNDAAVTIAHVLYGTPVPCEEALDIDRYRGVRVTDAILLLSYLFLGGMAPELPFPDCARLLTPRDVLPCERSSCGP